MEWDSCSPHTLPPIYFFFPATPLILSLCLCLSFTHNHTHMQLFLMALSHASVEFPLPVCWTSVYVCVYLCVCRGGRTEASRRRWTGAGHTGHPQGQIMSAAWTSTHYMHLPLMSVSIHTVHAVSLFGYIGEELKRIHLKLYKLSGHFIIWMTEVNVCFSLSLHFTHKQRPF